VFSVLLLQVEPFEEKTAEATVWGDGCPQLSIVDGGRGRDARRTGGTVQTTVNAEHNHSPRSSQFFIFILLDDVPSLLSL
jgi:hypothetical protein